MLLKGVGGSTGPQSERKVTAMVGGGRVGGAAD